MGNAVSRGQRWTAERPCVICGGFDKSPRGKGLRCFGYMSFDDKFAHCTREDLAGELKQEAGETFAHRLEGDCRCGARHGDPPVAHIEEHRARRGEAKVVNEIVYDYEGGLRVIRRELEGGDKTFVQYHRNGSGYVPGRGEAPLTLYRAPELRSSAIDAFVFLVEGEKCVDALRIHDLVATTTAGGSGQWAKTAEKAAELLRGRHVVILPDNDDKGRSYAAAARETLLRVARSLRMLELPRLGPAEDVVDWMRRGGEPEDLVRLAEVQVDLAAPFRMPIASEAALRLFSVALPPPIPTGIAPLDAVIGGLMPESFVVINAPPGRGKSGFALQVTRGILAAFVAARRNVLYLSSELSERQVISRVVAQIWRVPWLRIFHAKPHEAADISTALQGLALRVVRIRRQMSVLDELNRCADEAGTAPILVLDYLQHAARRLAIEDRRIAVGALIDDIGTWACDTRSTGLLVSSVGRGQYRPDDDASAEEFLGAGKEAGEIECDASAELFLQADLPPEGGSAPAKLHVSKNRFGPSGRTIGLIFEGATGLFRDDATAALSEGQKAIYKAIADGATSAPEINEAIKAVNGKGVQKDRLLKDIRVLRRALLVDGPPLRVLEKPA